MSKYDGDESGDGPFQDFFAWYGQFYSESSAQVGRRQLEW